MSIFTSKRERIRFLKFATVGITGSIVDFGIMNLLSLVVGIPLVYAQAISFVCAVINNFLWNRYWTYPESRSGNTSKQLVQFFIINVIGILIRTPLVPWLDGQFMKLLQHMNWNIPFENNVISQNLALAVSITIVMLWNYFANRYWTYDIVPNGDPDDEAREGRQNNRGPSKEEDQSKN